MTGRWTDFTLTYTGYNGRPVTRPARSIRTPDTLWVVVTEIGEGTSVTNSTEEVWRAVRRRWPSDRVRILEHYGPEHGMRERWAEYIPGANPFDLVIWFQHWDPVNVRLVLGDAAPWHPAHNAPVPAPDRSPEVGPGRRGHASRWTP